VGVSDAILLFVSAIGFVMLAVTIYSIVLTRFKSAHEIEQEERELNYMTNSWQMLMSPPSTEPNDGHEPDTL
jgi:hypothetical protein